MSIAITGAGGFLGWHLSCRLLALRGAEPIRIDRATFQDPGRLAEALADVDTVIHVAGANRGASDSEVERDNAGLAEQLASALADRPVHVVYANSVQANLDNSYGRGKRRAAEMLSSLPGTCANVLLPNLFGEHGRPQYNSFVATFADDVAHGRQPDVSDDRDIPLLHAQDAAQALMDAADRRESRTYAPTGEEHRVSEVLDLLKEFHALYAVAGDIPDVSSQFRLNLFNTYRAALWPSGHPLPRVVHADARGELVETVRSHGGRSQGYVSFTRPGQTRGEHFHLRKIERFVVVRGDAEINVRRLFTDDVVTFRVSGAEPVVVDMPTMWAHNIVNVGGEDVVTVFWSDQLLDPGNADQYPMQVQED